MCLALGGLGYHWVVLTIEKKRKIAPICGDCLDLTRAENIQGCQGSREHLILGRQDHIQILPAQQCRCQERDEGFNCYN